MSQELSTFLINPTKTTPFVEFDYNDGKLDIIGKRAPKSSPEFYQQIYSRIQEYRSAHGHSLNINISFEESDVSSNEDFIDLLKALKPDAPGQKEVSVNWYYDGYEDSERKSVQTQMNELGITCHMHAYSSK